MTPAAWEIVRRNFERAGGGSASRVAATEKVRILPELGKLPLEEFAVGGEKKVATTAMGAVVGAVGLHDTSFIVTNADGNEASGIANINKALQILHPTPDDRYFQSPTGRVYEPLSEDACAGLAAGIALMGGRSLWCSYEAFAINGLPIWQTVTQAMAELRRPTPSNICLFTAGALEQGRNGWTHQRPEIEAYLAAMMRNGNIFPIFPADANSIQVAYEWALGTKNKGIIITASKSPLPIYTTFEQGRQGLQDGGIVLHESAGEKTVVFAVVGDMSLIPVFEAAKQLESQGMGVRVVSVINPRRLYRPSDVLWEEASEPDGGFLDDAGFEKMFGGDALIGVTGGAAGMLEPLMLRSSAKRDVFAWKRGETTATPGQIMEFNGLSPEALTKRAIELVH
jgi:phosphoketolase